MKKSIAFIICLVMIISLAACAFASDADATITGTLTSTSVYSNVTPSYATKTKSSSNWNAPFNGASDSQRVVARVYKIQDTTYAASSTWVYSAYSTTAHPYKANYTGIFTAFLGAKVDNRDEGPITVSGIFHSCK